MIQENVNNPARRVPENDRRAAAGRQYHTAVVGGGAAGLFFAAKYGDKSAVILERGERVGRKLSATGGGWGNVTNLHAGDFSAARNFEEQSAGKRDAEKQGEAARKNGDGGYFTFENAERGKIERALEKYSPESLRGFLHSIGCVTFADERGRVYPFSRQASSVSDCLRAEAKRRGVTIVTGAEVAGIVSATQAGKGIFKIVTANGVFTAENVLLCTGGRAAKHFGSDGGGYALAQTLGHSVTKTFPALVQMKCAEKEVRALKGIRVFDGEMTLLVGGKEVARERGDILFTDYGVSGDCAFKISSYLPCDEKDRINARLSVDFLPDLPLATLEKVLYEKKNRYKNAEAGALFTGIVNNRIGETIARRVKETEKETEKENRSGCDEVSLLAETAKAFSLTVTGTTGFDNAQVTKGGIPLSETDGTFQSLFTKNVYFAGEILDVDGACGGYNLQWAYSSACAAAEGIFKSRL